MGNYIGVGSLTIKVTGTLTSVLPEFGSQLDAEKLLHDLQDAICKLENTEDWAEALSTGAIDQINKQARTEAFVIPDSGPVRLWFEHRKLEQAYELVRTAHVQGQALTWS